jgi:hypothetical protein
MKKMLGFTLSALLGINLFAVSPIPARAGAITPGGEK